MGIYGHTLKYDTKRIFSHRNVDRIHSSHIHNCHHCVTKLKQDWHTLTQIITSHKSISCNLACFPAVTLYEQLSSLVHGSNLLLYSNRSVPDRNQSSVNSIRWVPDRFPGQLIVPSQGTVTDPNEYIYKQYVHEYFAIFIQISLTVILYLYMRNL